MKIEILSLTRFDLLDTSAKKHWRDVTIDDFPQDIVRQSYSYSFVEYFDEHMKLLKQTKPLSCFGGMTVDVVVHEASSPNVKDEPRPCLAQSVRKHDL